MSAVLGNILPGLRQVRAPLAAGYLWLLAVWVSWGHAVTIEADSSGLGGDISRLVSAAGTGPVLIAVTFAAYVIGTVTTPLNIAVLRPFLAYGRRGSSRQRSHAQLHYSDDLPLDHNDPYAPLAQLLLDQLRARVRADESVQHELERRIRETRFHNVDIDYYYVGGNTSFSCSVDAACESLTSYESRYVSQREALIAALVDVQHYWTRLVEDSEARAPQRLLSTRPELHGNYDRYEAESEFRLAIVPPLALSVVALTFQDNAWWLLGLVPCFVLLSLGYQSRRDALFQLTQSLASDPEFSSVLSEIAHGPIVWRDSSDAAHRLNRALPSNVHFVPPGTDETAAAADQPPEGDPSKAAPVRESV